MIGSAPTFEEVLAAVEAGKDKFAPLHDLLTMLKKEKIRRPDLVVKHGKTLINKYARKLGDEVWPLYEQVFIAALDAHEEPLALEYLQILQKKFPESKRVGRLQGMYLEFKGDFDKAENLYEDIIKEQPANLLVMKRHVSILKARGKREEAIKTLNNLLATFCTETSLWQELAHLYLDGGNYTQAAFCYEELLLSNPIDPFLLCQLAELYYTIGGYEKLRDARKYFAESLRHKKGYPRALIGLALTASTIKQITVTKAHKAEKEQDGELNERLLTFARDNLKRLYENIAPDTAALAISAIAPIEA